MSNYYRRKRTIAMPQCRSDQIAIAAAFADITSEEFIQTAVTNALLDAAGRDLSLALALARAGGASWEDLEALAKNAVAHR